MNDRYDIIVIGSGLGGLLSGFILAKEGKKVCILEKEKHPGGCLRTFKRKGRTFSTGVHYFGGLDEGGTLNRYWKYFGLTDRPFFKKMDDGPFDIISFPGKDFPFFHGKENFVEHLAPYFPGSSGLIKNYLQNLDDITSRIPLYNLKVPDGTGLEERNINAWEFFSRFSEASGLLPSVLSGNNFIYGGDQSDTPLYVAAVINHSFISGSWRMAEGYDSEIIAETLLGKFQSFGGTIHTCAEVKGISTDTSGFTVNTHEGIYYSDKIISAIHPSVTIGMLDGIKMRKVYRDRMLTLENTPPAFSLYLCMKPGTFPHLSYNVHYSAKPGTWFSHNSAKPDHYMLYTIPDSEGKHAGGVVIMMRSSAKDFEAWNGTITGQRGERYEERKNQMAENLLDLVEEKYPEIRNCTEQMEISTALTWSNFTGTPGGSMFGIKKDCREPLQTWIPARTMIPGIYFTGQSTNLHGVLGVTISAVQTCGEILELPYLLNKIKNV